jgi:hypothetical protein
VPPVPMVVPVASPAEDVPIIAESPVDPTPVGPTDARDDFVVVQASSPVVVPERPMWPWTVGGTLLGLALAGSGNWIRRRLSLRAVRLAPHADAGVQLAVEGAGPLVEAQFAIEPHADRGLQEIADEASLAVSETRTGNE